MQILQINTITYNYTPHISFERKIAYNARKTPDLKPFYEPKKKSIIEKFLSLFSKKPPIDDRTMFALKKFDSNWKNFDDISLNNLSVKDLQRFHKQFENQPELLAELYLRQDMYGKTPVHNASLNTLQEMHNYLKTQPELLAKLHLTQNAKGKLPAHREDIEFVREINSALQNQPDVLRQVHLTKNKKGDYPINYQKAENVREIIQLFENDPETIIKLLKNNHGFDIYTYAEIRSIITEYSQKYNTETNAAINSLMNLYV